MSTPDFSPELGDRSRIDDKLGLPCARRRAAASTRSCSCRSPSPALAFSIPISASRGLNLCTSDEELGDSVDERSSMSNFSSSSSSDTSSSSSMSSSFATTPFSLPDSLCRLEVGVGPSWCFSVDCLRALRGLSSTTTNDFWRSRSFHLRVRDIEWNQSRDCDSAQTVGNGYLDAVTLMWSPSALAVSIP